MRWLHFLKCQHLEHDFYWFRLNVYIACNMVYVPLEKVLSKWRCVHVTIAGEGLQNLALWLSLMAFGIPALTQVISLCSVIRKSTPFSCLILGSYLAWHVRGTVKLLFSKSHRDFIWFWMNSISWHKLHYTVKPV